VSQGGLRRNVTTPMLSDVVRNPQEASWRKCAVYGLNGLRPTLGVKPGNRVAVEVRQIVPGDGEVIQSLPAIEESATTGESAPVICEAQGVRSYVSAGTLVVSGQIVIQITSGARTSFLDRMILLMRSAGNDPKQDRIRAASEPVAVAV